MRIPPKKNLLTCDCHTHILPGMDDGAQTVEQAVKMLQLSCQYGVETVLLTPHYYSKHESPAAFLQRREDALDALKSAYTEALPRLELGAEVYLAKGISKLPDLEKLCIGASGYLLLEMPYMPLADWMIEEIEAICFERNCKPLFAHLMRYAAFYQDEDFAYLLDFPDAIMQANIESMQHTATRRQIRHLIAKGIPVVFGSDCHNMDSRKPNLDVAGSHIAKLCEGISPIEQAQEIASFLGWI